MEGLVLVTGSTAGIGKAVAEQFVQQGRTVVVNGRKPDVVQAVVEQLNSNDGSGKAVGVAGDLGTEAGCQQFIKEVEAHGQVAVLVNNMGMFEVASFFEVSDDRWHEYIDVNFFSTLRLSRHFLKGMLDRKQGRIISISSEAGVRIIPDMMAYSITKQMQIGLSHGMAQLTKGTGVTVNTVMPGPTWTEGVEVYIQGLAKQQGVSVEEATAAYFKAREPTSLLQRFIQPAEAAAAVVFLASEGASAINGHAMRVEGGLIRHVGG